MAARTTYKVTIHNQEVPLEFENSDHEQYFDKLKEMKVMAKQMPSAGSAQLRRVVRACRGRGAPLARACAMRTAEKICEVPLGLPGP